MSVDFWICSYYICNIYVYCLAMYSLVYVVSDCFVLNFRLCFGVLLFVLLTAGLAWEGAF